jgi:hypothetical protein
VVGRLVDQFPMKFNKENISWIREMFDRNSEFHGSNRSALAADAVVATAFALSALEPWAGSTSQAKKVASVGDFGPVRDTGPIFPTPSHGRHEAPREAKRGGPSPGTHD